MRKSAGKPKNIPPKFTYQAENRCYLDKLLAYFKGVPAVVEFQEVSLVSLDMPEPKDLPPLMDVVTAPFSYIRLHGRNGEAWHGSGEMARADRIKWIVVQAARILVYFNNHARGQAVKNRQTLVAILDKARLLSEVGEGKDMAHEERP
jgi:uncharacterized protein YecE (DUF72 family)